MLIAASESPTLKSIGQLCSVLLIFVFVLAITYFATRWIAGYQKSQMDHRNMRIVETMRLTVNKYIQIIEVGDVYLVIGVGKDHIETLAELSKEHFKEVPHEVDYGENGFSSNFSDVLDQIKKRFPKK